MRLSHSKQELEIEEFDVALLVLVRSRHQDNGITAYEIVKLNEEGMAGLLGRSQASIYSHLRRLAKDGFVTAEAVPGKRGRDATKYALTRKGYDALLVWIDKSKVKLPALDDSQAFLRIRAARVFGAEDLIWKGLEPMGWDIEDWRGFLDEDERNLRREGRWTVSPAIRLEYSLMRALLNAYDGWLHEVERELGIQITSSDE